MNKEYTGAEFEVEFARAWYEYVKGGKVGVDPHCNWEFRSDQRLPFESVTPSVPPFSVVYQFRWKPIPKRTVKIGYYDKAIEDFRYKTLVAPEVEAPPLGTAVYTACSDGDCSDWVWNPNGWVGAALKHGLVFLTREDAQAMTEWLSVCRRGGAA